MAKPFSDSPRTSSFHTTRWTRVCLAKADSEEGRRALAESCEAWPEGMAALVNSPQRIHGYFVNAEDVFFFVGDQKQFEELLTAYAKIDGILAHKIFIHEGRGRAKSPWQETGGIPCDWMVYGCPASWKRGDPAAKGYILEVHLWKEGKIKADTFKLPEGILVEPAKDTETTDRN